MTVEEPIYRIIFYQDGKTYEVYARYISEEHLMGFIEVEDLLFGDQQSSLVIDTGEEKLRAEFKGVKRTYIPMHNIVRIDEVKQQGVAKITESKTPASNIRQFPSKEI